MEITITSEMYTRVWKNLSAKAWIYVIAFLCTFTIAQVISPRHVKTFSANELPKRFEAIRPIIEEVSRELGFNPALAAAVIKAESEFRTRAVSPRGAVGLMQVLPSTARLYGVRNPFDPKQNIKAGLLYLRALWHQFGELELALAAYNAGPGNVAKYGDIPPFKETRSYVPKVMSNYNKFRIVFSRG